MAKGTKDHTFSLVEYLMIVMIVGILIVFIVPFTQANQAQPKIREMKNNVNSILKAYDQTGLLNELKLSEIEDLNREELNYSIGVNDFLKYVNFEKDFAKKYLSFTKKKDYLNFLKTEVRPLVKVAYLSKFDKYVNDVSLVKLNFDYDVLPNLGTFLEDDKFFDFYDLAERRFGDFVTPGLEEQFNNEIIQVITFIKGLKPEDGFYNLTYNQIRNFTNINVVDLNKVEDQYFAYKVTRDSTIIAETTENFGSKGAQIIYSIQDEIYQVGPRSEYMELGPNFLEENIAKLPALSQERDAAINSFKASIKPEELDLNVSLISDSDRELFTSFESYIKENFKHQDIEIYSEFYKNFDAIISSAISNNKTSLENAVETHDKMRNPSQKAKTEITERVDNWEKLIDAKAKLDNRIKSLNEINTLINKVETVEDYQSLKENYINSFNVIDQDWLILE